MISRSPFRGLATLAVLVALSVAQAWAQNMFYREVERDGRIYVFANGPRYETFEKSGGTEVGVAISRLAYGPKGETVVFDSEDAINYYNFKHDKPGEVFAKPKPPAAPTSYPHGKINGLVFGDFYYFKAHHDTKFDGQEGFWIRRAYLGWDQSFSESTNARIRLEMNSNGTLAGGNLVPFVKDAYVTWKYRGKHSLRLGLQPSLTFDSEDSFWGMRHIEKTPADLYGIDASRDLALGLAGPLGGRGVSYNVQLGNDSGSGSETDRYKVVRLQGLFEPKSGLRIEGVFNRGQRPNGQDRTSVKGLVGFKSKAIRLAGQYVWQERKSGKAGTPDTTLEIWSGFAVWDIKPKRASVFGRLDVASGDLGGTAAGLPGVDGIPYLSISSKAPFKAGIFGAEFPLGGSLRISPNVEVVRYDDLEGASTPTTDVLPRLTFFWSW